MYTPGEDIYGSREHHAFCADEVMKQYAAKILGI
jgi:hypothetical protein